jgi:hypothetical protein
MFGEQTRRRLAGRERELFPRFVRPWALAVLWVTAALVFTALATVGLTLHGLLR